MPVSPYVPEAAIQQMIEQILRFPRPYTRQQVEAWVRITAKQGVVEMREDDGRVKASRHCPACHRELECGLCEEIRHQCHPDIPLVLGKVAKWEEATSV